jgi:hypothetical protein
MRLVLTLSALAVALTGCGLAGCPTPADCADVTCACIQPIGLRPDANAAELARETPPPAPKNVRGQAW